MKEPTESNKTQSMTKKAKWETPVLLELTVADSEAFKFFTTKLDADGGPMAS